MHQIVRKGVLGDDELKGSEGGEEVLLDLLKTVICAFFIIF